MVPSMASDEVSDFEHARRMLIMSSFIYSHSEIRKLSSIGKSSIPFEILQTEFDFMTRKEIISGTEHKWRASDSTSNIGFSGMDFLYIVLRSISAEGFNDETNKNTGKTKEVIARKAFVLKLVDDFLKHALVDSPKRCTGHVGCICKKRGFHHVQSFFDRIQKNAELNEKGNAFELVRDMLLGKKDDNVDRRTPNHRVRGQDTIWRQALFQSVISKSYFDRTILNDNIRTVWLNDHYDSRECVYAIVLNRDDKSVTVVFRGTSNITDWRNNLMQKPVETLNPIKEKYSGKKETISFHKGFYKLLIQPRHDNGRRKYDEIADKAHEYGKELGEGFRLNATGHSLGGSLATLFGFYASTDERFNQNNPVRVTSFGSPVFGRVSFAKAFLHQEKAEKLSHARFVLDKDCIPYTLPFCGRGPAHTGYRIKLSQKKGVDPAVSYPYAKRLEKWSSRIVMFQNSVVTKFFTSPSLVFSPGNVVRYHDLPAYWCALENAALLKKRRRRAALQKLAMETLFSNISNVSISETEEYSSGPFLERACENGDLSQVLSLSLAEKEPSSLEQEKAVYLTNTMRRIDELRQLGYSNEDIQEWFPDTRPFLGGEKAVQMEIDCDDYSISLASASSIREIPVEPVNEKQSGEKKTKKLVKKDCTAATHKNRVDSCENDTSIIEC